MKKFKYTIPIIVVGLIFSASCNSHSGMDEPYFSEIVQFTCKNFNITGELLIPKGKDSYPMVIMVHGDGPSYKSDFPTIKNSFLKAGYATLIWDKPGFGQSTGVFSNKHLRKERAEILVQAIKEMKKHPQINADKIGVWGISQAGYVIPMALEKTNDISFMILVGVGGENGIYQTAYYIREQLMCEGVDKEFAKKAEEDFIGLYYAKTFDEYYNCAKPLVDNPQIRKMGFVTAMWTEDEWKPKDIHDEGFYNPIDVMQKIKIPTMVFFGDLDKNVNPFQGLEAYQSAFEKAGNSNFVVKMMKGSDHNIIISKTGCLAERRNRTRKGWTNYDPEYLKMMENWLIELESKHSI